MKLTDQVPSRELCEQLNKLGYPQEGLFWHAKRGNQWTIDVTKELTLMACKIIFAPTVSEMGEWIYKMPQQTFPARWHSGLWCYHDHNGEMLGSEETEANARAQLLIYLDKLIDFSKPPSK